jgi:hypothetical protein
LIAPVHAGSGEAIQLPTFAYMSGLSMFSRVVPVVLGLVALLAPSLADAGGMSARDVMKKNEEARRVKEMVANSNLTTGADGEDPKAKSFTMWRKLGSDNVHSKSFTKFNTPAEVRGEAILFEEAADAQNDVQLYLPRFKKVRRVEASSQSTSFMGSAFSYSDMTASAADDFKHTLLKTEPCPNDTKVSCYVIESIPTAEGAKERTAYSKSVGWIRSDNFLMAQAECYDRGGALWKRVVASDIREIDASAHKMMAHNVRVDDLKSKRYSILTFSGVKTNSGIPDSTFTQQNLSRE